jgi:PKD repeat protein
LLHDINGDGIDDVLIGSLDFHFYAFNGPDGSVIWRSDRFEHFVRASSPIGDIDNDGDLEVVVVDNHAIVRLYNAVTGAMEWENTIGYGVEATPVLADVDGDGYDEIILFTFGWVSMGISGDAVVLNHDGTELWRSSTYTYFYTSPTVLDIDGDGLVDIICGDTDDHTIIAYKGTDGTILWETVLPDSSWSQGPLVTADIDSDGVIEVIAGANPNLYCLSTVNGTIEWVFETTEHIWGQPTIADLEQDGYAEILFGCYDDFLYVLENADEPPIADAGEDQTVYEGDIVGFNGSQSYDPDPVGTKVLHISVWPYYNEVQDIIDSAGATDYFDITKVTLSQYNNGNPASLDEYDVIIFGISDAYEEGLYIPITRLDELYAYVSGGGGIVWTHDSLDYGTDYGWKIETPAGVDHTSASWFGQNIPDLKIALDHPVVHIPFQIGNVGDTFTKTTYTGRPDYYSCRYAHSTGGVVTDADIVIRHDSPSNTSNNFYLTVKEYAQGRVVVTNMGHIVTWVDGSMYYPLSQKECQVLANALFWAGKGSMDAPLYYSWDLNNFIDSDSDGDFTNDVDATGLTPTHIYGDDGVFTVTLTVTDDQGLSDTDTCNITVLNIDPTISMEPPYMDVDITISVAGSKWSNVGMTLYEDDEVIGYIEVERWPGNPDDNPSYESPALPTTLDLSNRYRAVVTYDPYPDNGDEIMGDQPNNGKDKKDNAGNPVWIILRFENGSEERIHHTFNTQQSMIRDSEHWNHVEPWEVELNDHLIGHPYSIPFKITDPGSDDETLAYDYGSQSGTIIYLNDPLNPDPYPSPNVKPVNIDDELELIYEGPGTLTLTVVDDDGGLETATMEIG